MGIFISKNYSRLGANWKVEIHQFNMRLASKAEIHQYIFCTWRLIIIQQVASPIKIYKDYATEIYPKNIKKYMEMEDKID